MFDFDGAKFLIIGIVALLVIGPKDLPRVLRQIGQWTGKLRRMASEFQGQFMDAMREADIDSIKKEVRNVADAARVDTRFDPLGDIRREIGGIKSDWKSDLKPSAAAAEIPRPGEAASAVLTAASDDREALPTPTGVTSEASSAVPPTTTLAPPPSPPTLPAPGSVGSLPRRVASFGTKPGSS